MKRKDLLKKHIRYTENIDDWTFYQLAYEGGTGFIKKALGKRNSRESIGNFNQRIADGVCFNYAEAIIDLFNFYLTEKTPIRTLEKLKHNKQWTMFLDDADLTGTDFNVFMDEAQKLSSVFGSIGILTNKPASKASNVAQEIDQKVYPYVAVYTLPNIFDWKFGKDPVSGRPILTYLKLKDDNDEYCVWYQDRWEIWEDVNIKKDPVLVESGQNSLGEIPFIWMQNVKKINSPFLGKSDIVDISRITASIVRDISMGDEIIKFAGFPMMRKPMQPEGAKTEDETGAEAIHEFDPSFGEYGKPDWMKTEVLEPIEAILMWTDRKTDEIYRVAHLSGVHGQRKSNNEVSSGLALRYEFQQLTSVLTKKSNNMSEAERSIVRFWKKWQNIEVIDKDIDIKRAKEFSIDDLSINLENTITAMKNVVSEKFRILAQQEMAKRTLPDVSEKNKTIIDQEIENNKGKIEDFESKKSEKVKPANRAANQN